MACSALGAVSVFWVEAVDPAISVQFVLLTLPNILNVLQRNKEYVLHQFTNQVKILLYNSIDHWIYSPPPSFHLL